MAKPTTAKTTLGRPRTGKRSDPAYSQRSLWLSNALYARVSHKLISADGQRYQFSALVEHLLDTWLKDGAKLPIK